MADETGKTESENSENIAQTVSKLAEALGKTENVSQGENPLRVPHIVSVAKDRRIENLMDHYREAVESFRPIRRRGSSYLTDAESLIQWANRFKGEESVLYADDSMRGSSIRCVANYHLSGPPEDTGEFGDDKARNGDHVGIYSMPLSDEMKKWLEIDGELVEKNAMAEFIEDRAMDFLDPTPAILANKIRDNNQEWENDMIAIAQRIGGRFGQLINLLEISRNFLMVEKNTLSLKTDRSTGEMTLVSTTEHQTPDGKPMRLPNLFMLDIPIFKRGRYAKIPVRFLYRKRGDTVNFGFTLHDFQRVFREEFELICDYVASETDLPLFCGQQE